MQSTINERLKILVGALGTNQNALAVMLGLSPSTFRNYTDRESKPGYEVLEKLYHSFKHINLYWLFGEPGEPLLGDDNSGVQEPKTINQSQAQNQKRNQGNIIGINHGSTNQQVSNDDSPGADLKLIELKRAIEKARLEHDLELAKLTIEHLQKQLADKEKQMADKEEIISLLKQPKL